jgi:GNAT superfamily N-acetyltransferase
MKNTIPMNELEIKLSVSPVQFDASEPEYYVREYSALLIKKPDDFEEIETESKIIGGAEFVVINASLARDRELIDVFSIFDQDETMENYYSALTGGNLTHQLSKAAARAIGEWVFVEDAGIDSLYIHRLGILPEYRGSGLGLSFLRVIIEQFGSGSNIVALETGPFEFSEDNIKGGYIKWQTGDDNAEGQKKLERYYSKLGFNKISGTHHMVLSCEYRLPVLDNDSDL